MNHFDRLRDAVISEVILPALMKLDEETNQSIKAKVSIRWQSSWIAEEIRTRPIQSESAAVGEVRVVLKQTTANNVSMSAVAILKGLSPGSGFSGFSLRGKLEFAADKWSAKLTAHTNRYNVWEWGKEFAQEPFLK
jgi:hypothetical protein